MNKLIIWNLQNYEPINKTQLSISTVDRYPCNYITVLVYVMLHRSSCSKFSW